jgi:hypothetical protein
MALVQYQLQITQLDQVWELIKIGKGFVFRKWVYKVCSNTTSFTPPLCIEVFVPSQESEQSCICVLGIYILSLSMIPQLDFWDFPTVFLFCFSFYYICLFVYLMVFNATFNHISVISCWHFIIFVCLFIWWCLTPLSIIFQLYRVDILLCLFVCLFDGV